MLDFVEICCVEKRDYVEIFPSFQMYLHNGKSSDLMIKGRDFYAVWNEHNGLWSTDEGVALRLIDEMVIAKRNELKDEPKFYGKKFRMMLCKDSNSGVVDKWHKYCQKQSRDNFHPLDEKIIFDNDEFVKEDYASKRLPYPLKKGSTKNWTELLDVLYLPEEKHKLEWSIGAIVTGASKKLQKFVVLYGAPKTGKSTFLNIVEKLFDGYHHSFDAKALGNPSNTFALEPFKDNPLIAIQQDGDLSRIEDNTRLNSIVSHDVLPVNEKFKSLYEKRFTSFLYIGTNTPVKITDSKSGILRRLIDVHPTGNIHKKKRYDYLMAGIEFELGAICYRCKEIFEKDPHYYDGYTPVAMMATTNDFYDYILENTDLFESQDFTTLKQAWQLYKDYCNDSNIPYPYKRIKFKDELKNYFLKYEERSYVGGAHVRNFYSGFIIDKFKTVGAKVKDVKNYILLLDKTTSLLDEWLKDCPAQYASEAGTPNSKWTRVRRTLKDLDTSKLHYVKVPENHIVIDFDIKDPETGEKSYEENLKAASRFPPTYAEVSKSGAGIHLHYIYDGDVSTLKSIYDKDIEVKVFKGNASLRRMLTKCNDMPIATISSGLPLKEKKGGSMDFEGLQNEKAITTTIRRAMDYKYHANTKPSVDWIKEVLDRAYDSGISYDVSNMRGLVFAFASNSTHNKEYCTELLKEMKWKSKDREEEFMNAPVEEVKKEPTIVFFDVEVFPNLFIVCWKRPGKDKHITRMINPTPQEIENLISYDLVGFNNRKYDNHIIYARFMGYSNEGLYKLSQKIINNERGANIASAWGISYTDIYDFSSKKQSLKKWEIELGIHHKELGLPWDQPVDESLWEQVAAYCDNDVIATEAVWNARQADYKVRLLLSELSGLTPNHTNRQHVTKIIFGNDKQPELIYTDLATGIKTPGR